MRLPEIDYLIVTNKRDITSDFIIREMKERGHAFLRLNTEDIPKWKLFQSSDCSSTILQKRPYSFSLDKIKSAYFRRPEMPDTGVDNTTKAVAQYRQNEWNYILKSLYLELGEKWFSHPNNIILAENKPEQLRLARTLGFNVPETIITNDISRVEALFSNGDVVAKPLFHSLVDGGGGDVDGILFTTTISQYKDIDKVALSLAPVIFQRKVHKKYDIRATVVGDKVFATAIDSQKFKATQTDWRHTDIECLAHSIIELDKKETHLCVEMVKSLGLRYGAIDLVMDTDGLIWFLECNPNGQWAWIQNRTGVNIAGEIVDVMEIMQ